MGDLILAAFLGFALGVILQEIHFRKITRELDDSIARLERLEAASPDAEKD